MIAAAWSSATRPSAIATLVVSCLSRAAASFSRCLAIPLGCRVALAQKAPVSAAPISVPSPIVLAAWAADSSREVTRCRSPGQRGQGGGEVLLGHGPEGGVEVVELGVDAGDSGHDRVGPGSRVCRCHTGNSPRGHRQSGSGNRGISGAVENFLQILFGGRLVVVEQARNEPRRDHRPAPGCRGLDALAGARCSTTRKPADCRNHPPYLVSVAAPSKTRHHPPAGGLHP